MNGEIVLLCQYKNKRGTWPIYVQLEANNQTSHQVHLLYLRQNTLSLKRVSFALVKLQK